MIEQGHMNGDSMTAKVLEARYSYYRRCQVFRRNGEQCKAPAETGALICHAHAGQLAMAVRRERERRAVLAEAVAEMRRRGKPECEMADLFTDFKGIQVTVAAMGRALINGRIDGKTAGQMVVHLQTCSKLLWLYHRVLRETQREKAVTTKDTRSTPLSRAQGRSGQATEHKGLPQMCADDRRLNSSAEEWPNTLPLIHADDTDLKRLPRSRELPKSAECPNQGPRARIFRLEVTAFGDRCRAHGPPESKAA
jgi:hypothetical protein